MKDVNILVISVTLKQQENHSLNIHIEEIHKQVRYNCDQCDHKATNKYCLKKHARYILVVIVNSN